MLRHAAQAKHAPRVLAERIDDEAKIGLSRLSLRQSRRALRKAGAKLAADLLGDDREHVLDAAVQRCHALDRRVRAEEGAELAHGRDRLRRLAIPLRPRELSELVERIDLAWSIRALTAGGRASI